MRVNFDLLALPGAEYCERDGVRGVFVPEEPNFEFHPASLAGKNGTPSRAVVCTSLIRARRAAYDWSGSSFVPRKYYDAYLANPNYVNRRRRCVFVYGAAQKKNVTGIASTPEDFERILED